MCSRYSHCWLFYGGESVVLAFPTGGFPKAGILLI